MGYTVNIETTGGHIGCHQYIDFTAFQSINGLFAQALWHVTIERFGRIALSLKCFRDLHGGIFCACENEKGVKLFDF